MNDLFGSPLLWVEQPVRLPAAKAAYTILDGGGAVLARAAEQGVSLRRQVTRAAFGDASQRTVQMTGAGGEPLLTITARAEGGATVLRPDGALVGTFDGSGPNYHSRALHGPGGHRVGEVTAAKVGRRYAVTDVHGVPVAQIEKKWTGVAKEVLTTADRYRVEIARPLADPLRVLVPVAAVALDLIFFESKDWPIG
ncbi:phospholipid scramblase-related protein [Thermomonospora umbrina]|uniref:Scramblase n=1 Tax=Thermomonospora umbrina TaxID=111806 RepID=A0A3D9SHM4_9ACTN|nr:phospholipid scramblase-related protein [Thermomonospora umbrina]REE95392.1 scramblase [Thermomonospora umbrina]